jgi:hypothetical protein
MSNEQNDALLESLYEQFLDEGFKPKTAEKMARKRLDEMGMNKGGEARVFSLKDMLTEDDELFERLLEESKGDEDEAIMKFRAMRRSRHYNKGGSVEGSSTPQISVTINLDTRYPTGTGGGSKDIF